MFESVMPLENKGQDIGVGKMCGPSRQAILANVSQSRAGGKIHG